MPQIISFVLFSLLILIPLPFSIIHPSISGEMFKLDYGPSSVQTSDWRLSVQRLYN